MVGNAATCPKCGKERFEGSLDCPFCGVVYSRYHLEPAPRLSVPPAGDPQEMAVPSAAPDPFGVDPGPAAVEAPKWQGTDLYDPTQAQAAPDPYRARTSRATTGPMQEKETLLSRQPVISLIVLGFVWLVLLTFVGSIFATSVDEDEAEARFYDVTGLSAPEEYDAAGFHKVRGNVVVGFTRHTENGPAVVMAYRRRGGGASPEQLVADLEGWLEDSAVETSDPRQGRGTISGQTVEMELLRIGPKERSRALLLLVPFSGPGGEPTLLVIAAPTREFYQLRRQYVS